MKLLFFLCNLMSVMSCSIPQNMMIDTPFLVMSDACWVASGEKYDCSSFSDILSMDPYEQKDIDYVCNCSRTTGFTNEQLANLSNKRLHESGLTSCTVSVINGFEQKQLKVQCPNFYREKCNTISIT